MNWITRSISDVSIGLILPVLASCSPVENTSNQHRESPQRVSREPLPPAGIPTDAKMVFGVELRKMVVGKVYGPKLQNGSTSESIEYLSPDGWWAKAPLANSFSPTPIYDRDFIWREREFCVHIRGLERCARIWKSSDDRLFFETYMKNSDVRDTFELRFYGSNTIFRAPSSEWRGK
jgi:hypothetical protein